MRSFICFIHHKNACFCANHWTRFYLKFNKAKMKKADMWSLSSQYLIPCKIKAYHLASFVHQELKKKPLDFSSMLMFGKMKKKTLLCSPRTLPFFYLTTKFYLPCRNVSPSKTALIQHCLCLVRKKYLCPHYMLHVLHMPQQMCKICLIEDHNTLWRS